MKVKLYFVLLTLLIFATFFTILFYKPKQNIVVKTTTNIVSDNNEPKVVDLQKLEWVIYKSENTTLEFKYPKDYLTVSEYKDGEDYCIRLGRHISPSYSLCYVYDKVIQNQNVEFFNDPLKFRNYNENNYFGDVKDITFNGYKAKLMVDDSLQQVPSDELLVFINDKNNRLDHLVLITYPKQDIDKYLKHNEQTWSDSLNEYKSVDIPISKMILDSINL